MSASGQRHVRTFRDTLPGVTVDLTDFEPRVRAHADRWNALAVEVTVKPITSGLSKNSTAAWFESADWLISLTVWDSGELDLDAGRRADGSMVNKVYKLETLDQLAGVFAELVALVRDGTVPTDAVTS